ncbi:unnamed protein product [Larinioides sclopetarius]|uniref:Uncharacterized protein n=1 Tax=Larinioides sclopetarius TaxID=280406 RepID=A0AAV2AZ25_9ARAC
MTWNAIINYAEAICYSKFASCIINTGILFVTESPKPPPPLEKTEDTLPQSQPEVPVTLESNSDIYCYDDDESEEESPLVRMHLRQMELEGREESFPKDRPYLLYEIDSEDGLHIQSRNLRDAWLKVYDELQDARIAAHMKQITLAPEDVNGPHMLGLDNPALMYLLEQLPGAECCPDYEFLFHQPAKEIIEVRLVAKGKLRGKSVRYQKMQRVVPEAKDSKAEKNLICLISWHQNIGIGQFFCRLKRRKKELKSHQGGQILIYPLRCVSGSLKMLQEKL